MLPYFDVARHLEYWGRMDDKEMTPAAHTIDMVLFLLDIQKKFPNVKFYMVDMLSADELVGLSTIKSNSYEDLLNQFRTAIGDEKEIGIGTFQYNSYTNPAGIPGMNYRVRIKGI